MSSLTGGEFTICGDAYEEAGAEMELLEETSETVVTCRRCREVILQCATLDDCDTLRRVQREQKPWVIHNFGARDSWQPLLGIGEEVGELMHAHLKAHQGIRSHEDHAAAKIDALADIIIFACDYATAEGIDITDALASTWDRVKQRDWKKDPEHSHESTDQELERRLALDRRLRGE